MLLSIRVRVRLLAITGTPGIVGRVRYCHQKGTYSSTRVLPGLTNAATLCQSTIETLFKDLRDKRKAWPDDFNLHAGNEK